MDINDTYYIQYQLVYNWVNIINDAFLSKLKNIETNNIIIIYETVKDFIDYITLFHEIFNDNTYSIKDYIVILLRKNIINNFEPYCKYYIDPFGLNTQLFQIGIIYNNNITLPEENEIYNIWKKIIDYNMYDEMTEMVKNNMKSCIIIIERDIESFINYPKIFNNPIGVNKFSIKEFIEMKLNRAKLINEYTPFGEYSKEKELEFFQIGINKNINGSPRLKTSPLLLQSSPQISPRLQPSTQSSPPRKSPRLHRTLSTVFK